MRFRRQRTESPAAKASPAVIAILEHDLLGIQHEPGSDAALAVAMSRTVDQDRCPHEEVVSTQKLGDLRGHGLCCACGVDMIVSDEGFWVRP